MTVQGAHRRRIRRGIALAVVAIVAAAGALVLAVWGPRQAEAGFSVQQHTITVPGGPDMPDTINLDAALYLPDVTPAPAVIVAHGFGGDRTSVDDDAQRLARAGFVALTYSARGFGKSEGLIALNSLDYEVADGRALIDWLTGRSEVLHDAGGLPRVGIMGESYGGALALMVAATDNRVHAVAATATWNNLRTALFPDKGRDLRVAMNDDEDPSDNAAPRAGVFQQAWAARLMTSVLTQPAGDADPSREPQVGLAGCGRLMPAVCAGYLQVAQTGQLTPEFADLLDNSSPSSVLGQFRAAALLLQGENDTLFGLDQADANARAIGASGVPLGVGWYPGGHDGGGLDDASRDRIVEWFTYYLSHSGPPASTAFQYVVPGPLNQSRQPRNRLLEVSSYPGSGSVVARLVRLPLEGPAQTVVNPPGGEPAAITSLPVGVGQIGASLGLLSAIPGQTAIFRSPPVDQPTIITGAPQVTISVSALATADAGGAGAGDAEPQPGPDSPIPETPDPDAPEQGSPDSGSPDSAVLFVSMAAVKAGSDGTATASAGPASDGGGDTGTSADGSDSSGMLGAAGDGTGAAPGTTGAGFGVAGSRPITGAVSPIRVHNLAPGGRAALVEVELPAVSYQLQTGESLEIRVATTNQAFHGNTAPAAYRVAIPRIGTLQIPTVPGKRIGGESGAAAGIAFAALAVASVLALAWVGRGRVPQPAGRSASVDGGRSSDRSRTRGTSRVHGPSRSDVDPLITGTSLIAGTGSRRAADDVPAERERSSSVRILADDDSAQPPILSIRGLRKEYPGGVVAVDDVSFDVRRGQVLGLLGPNGAGKTTTLRMVLGLISPTAGSVRLFGERVTTSSSVLSRVGSFVEASGFLPHLSGRSNLQLFWRATGRTEKSYFSQVLEIAGLGAAVDRKVRTYSQGMRQRLAIAQAMLGLPDLLLLDEPTNGLDPPQIHAMREVLRRYAATGRTVVVSSHLLAEVEQTCTDVVIISRGRTIAAGSVAEMISGSGETLISTPDPETAERVLRDRAGVREISRTTDGLLINTVGTDINALLWHLINNGVVIRSFAPHNRLEDVFLDLVGSGSSSAAPPHEDASIGRTATGHAHRTSEKP